MTFLCLNATVVGDFSLCLNVAVVGVFLSVVVAACDFSSCL